MQGNRCQERHDHSDMEWLERIEVETERRTVLRPIGGIWSSAQAVLSLDPLLTAPARVGGETALLT